MRGVAFSPVLHEKCWVGEGETDDPAALAFFEQRPETFVISASPKPVSWLDPLLNPSQLPLATSAGVGVLPEAPQQDGADELGVVLEEESQGDGTVTVVPLWPPGFPEKAKSALEAAGWTLDDVKAASDDQLEALPLIGKATVKAIRACL